MIRHAERLSGCDLRLVDVVKLVGLSQDLIVLQGSRTLAEEIEAIATGHSSLKDPMHSKHVIDPETRPLALAVDLGPLPLDWHDIPSFKRLAVAVKAAAASLQVPLTWGGDWHHFKDYPHYEIGG